MLTEVSTMILYKTAYIFKRLTSESIFRICFINGIPLILMPGNVFKSYDGQEIETKKNL